MCKQCRTGCARTGVVYHGALGGAQGDVERGDGRDVCHLPPGALQLRVAQEVASQRACAAALVSQPVSVLYRYTLHAM